MKLFRFGSLLALLVLVGTLVPVSLAAHSARQARTPDAIVNIQFINISDWHGQLDPNGGAGGAAELSHTWKALRAANPNTITLTAGDDFGASAPLASYFNEVPAVLAQRMMGIQVNTFGNHNFDRGTAHLQEMIELASSPTQPLTPSSAFTNGQPFSYVAANLANTTGVLTGVLPYKIIDVSGVQVAIIGLVNEDAPDYVADDKLGPIEITDSVQAAMNARAAAEAEGADVFVAITHKGLDGLNTGPLIDFAQGVNGFDIIFGDHTNIEFKTTINGALVTENVSYGKKFLKVNLAYDTVAETSSIVTADFIAQNSPPPPATPAPTDPAIVAMLKPYKAMLAQVYDGKIAESTGFFPRFGNNERLIETPLGNLVVDKLRERYNTQIAFTNGGGLRDTVPSTYAPVDKQLRRAGGSYKLGPRYDVLVGDIYALLPFGNSVVVRTVTGGQIWRMMETGLNTFPGSAGRFPQISGFKVTFDATRPVGNRVLSVTLDDGTQVVSDTVSSYTLATNDFINGGNDGYAVLKEGQGTTLDVMADVVLADIQATGVITPEITGRILNVTRMSPFADQVIAKNAQTAPIPFTITDPNLVTDPTTTTVTLKASSSNAALIPPANVVFGGSGTNRTVQVTPVAGQTGIATLLLEVSGKSKAFQTLVVVVNGPPTITANASVTSPEDTPVTVDVGVRDLDTRDLDLSVTATAANNILIPAQNLAFSGTGVTRTLTITPAANLSGSTTLTIAASDGVSTITKTLDVTFTAVNDAPTISAIADQTLLVGQSTGALAFSVGDLDNAAGSLVVTAESSNTTLVPNANIAISGTGANRTVTVTPAANQIGTTTITIKVTDGDKTSTETFTVTVEAEPEYNVFLPYIVR